MRYASVWEYMKDVIPPQKAEEAKAYATTNGRLEVDALLDLNIVNEDTISDYYEKQYPEYVSVKQMEADIDISVLEKFDKEEMKKLLFYPYNYDEKRRSVFIYMARPERVRQIEDVIRKTLGRYVRVRFSVIKADIIAEKLNEKVLRSVGAEDLGLTEDNTGTVNKINIDSQDASSLVNYVNQLIKKAQEAHASDIHIEPYENEFLVRFRIDGICHDIESFRRSNYTNVVNRIKTMAGLNTTNNKILQDGKINTDASEIRVNIAPTIYGEKVVMRLLQTNSDPSKIKVADDNVLSLDIIGLDDQRRRQFERIIQKPQGIILATGPVGSGKSTTLMAIINHIKNERISITTIESPVEYRIHGICQSEVNENYKVTFTTALEAALRQDPDVMLVGEIREEEAAKMAVSAANTGILILATLHTNTACSTVTRLVDMGASSYLVADALNAIINQRLMRRLCPNCKEKYTLTPDNRFYKVFNKETELYRARQGGCDKCNHTGYIGRIAAVELLIVSDKMRDAIYDRSSLKTITDIAISEGFKTIQEDGKDKVLAGLTSIEEAHRKLYFDEVSM
ncbi:MAG: GspE/PulE family protein [Clostridiales bacterium]|nr:GspE/PulE family protein [Clostridiales bacterium]